MARPHPALLDIAAGRPPAPADDAAALVTSALDHRMGGLLWSHVADGALVLPPRQARRLAKVDLWTQAHHRKLWHLAHRIGDRLHDVAAEAAVFKGVAAEHRWYDRPGERPCNDLDLLLRPADVARLETVVAALRPDHEVPPAVVNLVRAGLLPSVDLRVDGIDVDVHADLLKVEVPTRQREVFWSRTTMVPAPHGARVRALDPEATLVQFLLHLNKDRFARLLGFVDVARVVRREPQLDWGVVAAMLRVDGMTEAGLGALTRVTETLGLTPPPLLRPAGWRMQAWERLWPVEDMLHGRAGLVTLQHRQLWLPWLARGRMAEALRWWLRRRAFPARALLDYQLPDTRGPYLWRLVTGRTRRFIQRRREARATG